MLEFSKKDSILLIKNMDTFRLWKRIQFRYEILSTHKGSRTSQHLSLCTPGDLCLSVDWRQHNFTITVQKVVSPHPGFSSYSFPTCQKQSYPSCLIEPFPTKVLGLNEKGRADSLADTKITSRMDI